GGTGIGNLYRARSDAEATATVQAAWDAGVRYFDTAPLYGLTLSEQRMGRFFEGRARAAYALSTKVGRMLEPPADPTAFVTTVYPDAPSLRPHFDYTGEAVRQSFEQSLDRLGVETIDLLYLHDLAPMNHASAESYERHFRSFFDEGGYAAMAALKAEGR